MLLIAGGYKKRTIMKKLSSLLLALGLLATTTIFAFDATIADPTDTKTEFTKLLKNPEFIVAYEMQANVLFTVTDANEIVVLSVETEDQEVENFIKSRLNYRVLETKLEQGKQYIVPVRIKAKK